MPAISIFPITGWENADIDSHLPVFYMNDVSKAGMRVDRSDDVRSLLQDRSFSIPAISGGITVEISSPAQIPEICRLLQERGIGWTVTDLVETVYQG